MKPLEIIDFTAEFGIVIQFQPHVQLSTDNWHK
jgi:hypothetical protein